MMISTSRDPCKPSRRSGGGGGPLAASLSVTTEVRSLAFPQPCCWICFSHPSCVLSAFLSLGFLLFLLFRFLSFHSLLFFLPFIYSLVFSRSFLFFLHHTAFCQYRCLCLRIFQYDNSNRPEITRRAHGFQSARRLSKLPKSFCGAGLPLEQLVFFPTSDPPSLRPPLLTPFLSLPLHCHYYHYSLSPDSLLVRLICCIHYVSTPFSFFFQN